MSESDVVIRVEGLGKKYALHHEKSEHYIALRDVVARQAKAAGRLLNPFTLAGQLRKAQREAGAERAESEEEFWALKDVSFEICRGERVGIIGRNGAGKSTLLKVLSRITEPTTGRVEIRGRVASLLEVGTGFHPELTGRENIYLNGAILGMTRREIRSKFDEIVDFAEVEMFLDTPVKRYSSGMYVRLAFAVAAHLEAEILVVDEVLAVGDAIFQRKCLAKMKDINYNGRTILYVSHNLGSVSLLCDKSILLSNGCISCHDNTCLAIRSYKEEAPTENVASPRGCAHFDVLKSTADLVDLRNVAIDLTIFGKTRKCKSYFAFDIKERGSDIVLGQAFTFEEGLYEIKPGIQNLFFRVGIPKLIPGSYDVHCWMGIHNSHSYLKSFCAGSFEVIESPTAGRTFPHTVDHGLVVLDIRTIAAGTAISPTE